MISMFSGYALPLSLMSSFGLFNISNKINRYLKNYNQIKTITYNLDTFDITIKFSSPLKKEVVIRPGNFFLKDNVNSYTIITDRDSYELSKSKNVKIDKKIINYLGSPNFKDRDIESILTKDNGMLINFSCPFQNNIPYSLDTSGRQKLSQKISDENDNDNSNSNVNNMLKKSDTEESDNLNIKQKDLDETHDFEGSYKLDELNELTELLNSISFDKTEKAKELQDVLINKYCISNVIHLKGLSKSELKDIIYSLNLTNDEAEEFTNKVEDV